MATTAPILWNIEVFLFVISTVFTILAFNRNTEALGQILYQVLGGFFWGAFGFGLFRMKFYWGGSLTFVSATYTLDAFTLVPYTFIMMGVLFVFIGIIRGVSLSGQPVVDQFYDLDESMSKNG